MDPRNMFPCTPWLGLVPQAGLACSAVSARARLLKVRFQFEFYLTFLSALGKKERRPSSGSVHSTKPKVRRSVAHSQPPPVPKIPSTHQQHVKFSTEHSSDDNDGSEDGTLVHRKSTEIVESPPLDDFQEPPVAKVNRTSTAPAGWMPQPPPPLLQKQQIYPYLPQKSALKEGLSSSAPKFLQKSFSSLALAQPTVSHTNAMSKDLGKSATSIEHHVLSGRTPSSEGLVGPSSHPSTSHFVSSTPPSRGLRTPDSEISRGIRRNQSATSLATTAHDHTIPLSTTSQGKLTRTQQKLLLQRASTQPLTLQPTASHASPSIPQVAHMESITAQGGDYFAPMPPTPTPFTPGLQVNVPYDVKVAREFDRISKELVNARRFGDPTAAAICRLRERIGLVPSPPTEIPSGQTLLKKQSTFGLSMAWKRSPDKSGVTSSQPPPGKRSVDRDDVFGIVNRGKVKELARQLWFDEVVLADYMGRLRLDDDEEEVTVRKVSRRRRASARS